MAASPREGRGKKRARGVKNDQEGSQGPFHFVFWEKSGDAMGSGRDAKRGNDKQRNACSEVKGGRQRGHLCKT